MTVKRIFLFLALALSAAVLRAQPGTTRSTAATTTTTTTRAATATAGVAAPTPQPLGNVFNDSQFLLQSATQSDIKEIVRILGYYEIDTAEVSQNVYLKALLGTLLPKVREELGKAKALAVDTSRFSKATSGLATLFPARKVADGLGTFIAERFKEELTQRYLQAFRDSLVLNDDRYHYSVLLPKTYSALLIYENVFDYKSFMTALKEAFKEDLDNLAPHGLEFVNAFYEAGQLKGDEGTFYLVYYVADYLVNQLPQGVPPSYLLLNIDNYTYKEKLDKDIYGGIKIGNLVAVNLQDNQGDVSSEKIRTLLQNRRRLLAFSGLLIEKERQALASLTIGGKNGFALLNDSRVGTVEKIALQLEKIRRAAETFAKSKGEFNDIVTLASVATPSVQAVISNVTGTQHPTLRKGFVSIQGFINIYEYAEQEKYGLVITEALSLFDSLGLHDTGFYITFKKYGLFIANVAQAETSQQVKEALDVAALPVGSYKIKRNAFFDLSLNTYPGLAVGYEFRSDIPEGADVEDVTPTIGFTVPVGLAFSWGRLAKTPEGAQGKKTDNRNEFAVRENGKWITKYFVGRSNTVFFSVIDVGAITSFRLADDETETLPDFTWGNILAPGVYYVNGLKETPLSWGLGVQYGPQLRKIDQDGTELELAGSLISARIFLAVDIPIFNFYSRNTLKKRKNKT